MGIRVPCRWGDVWGVWCGECESLRHGPPSLPEFGPAPAASASHCARTSSHQSSQWSPAGIKARYIYQCEFPGLGSI
ncbi:hypothetical protein E2C01_011477 [Portunus trituberculatus]|uniref:Uncharacterized protein n=1 Tax=Portunus trituberculatus TaxID=210409 RepID=A0A5B7DBI5_PORTR|nr:hypothetical protein [Portunus trituberculatus]